MCGLRDGNSKFESQRPLNAFPLSSLSSLLVALSERGVGMPPKSFARSYLARITPLTFKAVARRCTIEAETTKVTKGIVEEVTQRRSSFTESEEAVINMSSYDLKLITSKVT